MARYWWIAVLAVLLSGCNNGPEGAARAEFEQSLKILDTPYQNIQVSVLQNDGSFATLYVSAEFRFFPKASWAKQEGQIECRKLGQEWSCDRYHIFLSFPKLPAELKSQLKGTIAFRSARDGNGYFQIYTMNANGENLRRLTDDKSHKSSPTISNDGTQIAFVRLGMDNGIYIADINGQNTHLLAKGVWQSGPTWSPDDQWIAYSNNEIYMIDQNSKQLRSLNESGEFPSWSPDGRRIAFVSRKNNYGSLAVIDISGQNISYLVNSYPDISNPSWSPDGSQIVFVSRNQLYIVNVENKSIKQITNHPEGAQEPTWSPDGRWIAFFPNIARNINSSLLIEAAGGNIYRFIENEGSISWRR